MKNIVHVEADTPNKFYYSDKPEKLSCKKEYTSIL
ncbi:hypothetical protein OTSSIDO_0344 [Orientia tsutsugamushi str. Sido]|nr:hypothetical protein OTSSIDO_0344 [Orientia tsutsugamushi str. Sido]